MMCRDPSKVKTCECFPTKTNNSQRTPTASLPL
jgi:hypothetical protein